MVERRKIGKTGSSAAVLFAAACVCALSLTAAHAQVTLTVGRGSALPGATDSPVTVSLDNPGNNIASGMEMTICDANNFLTCTGCETTGRSTGFSCLCNELGAQPDPLKAGCCKVVLYSLSSADIEIGTGPIFTLLNDVSSSASGQPCKELRILSDVKIADADSGRQLTAALQSGGFCFPCTADADCDDGLYCTGDESCSGNACVLAENPCSGQTVCVEATDECVASTSTSSSGPSSTTTTGPSSTTTSGPSTTTTGPSSTTTTAGIEVISGDVWKSRWVALPKLLVIEGSDTHFRPFKTKVDYDPRDAVLKFFPIVLGDNYIWNLILVMPSWFAGDGDQEVTVTVTTGDEIASDDFLIQELSFISDGEN